MMVYGVRTPQNTVYDIVLGRKRALFLMLLLACAVLMATCATSAIQPERSQTTTPRGGLGQ